MARPCTDPFLPVGHEMKDADGNTIAVLGEDRCFRLWEAGTWRAKQDKKLAMRPGKSAIYSAKKLARLSSERKPRF